MAAKFVELHACSAFSFLRGASLPEELAAEAARLGYEALALLDRDGFYGAPRFYKACREAGIRPLVGAEVSLLCQDTAFPLPLLVENLEGYRNLCRLITHMKLRSPKGKGSLTIEELRPLASGLICLTGGDNGLLGCLIRQDMEKAFGTLSELKEIFGARSLYVELHRHHNREEEKRLHQVVEWARRLKLPLLASNGVRYARPDKRSILDVLTCILHKKTLDTAGRLLTVNAECYLKPPSEMVNLFADLPEAISQSCELADRLFFTLENLGYRFPEYPTPSGETMIGYLRRITDQGARQRYRPYHEKARRQIERELNLIEKLNLAGYFLIVWDIIRFCREQDILVQGRGSAANSAVCYSLGITAVDPVGMDLLFERFLSEERGEWPDIDLDLPSGDRRERVIQYVYDRYGERGAAMTANVITYRGRSAAREIGKALGFPQETLDTLSRLLNTWGFADPEEVLTARFQEVGLDLSFRRVRKFLELWLSIQDLPRHLGQHSGGMVIAQGGLDAVVPLEPATMPGRKVIQWDKEDCADLGIIKVDLLGLGMMSALQDSIPLVRQLGAEFDLAQIPSDDPAVYQMLQNADTVGVFQVESRAQMATLPRLKPEHFYDLVVEVAIIRPGPIVGHMVHPYLRRRAGLEPVDYPHSSLEPILKRTMGVPLFQEQLLRIAMVAAGFTGGEAEELRRAMGFKRSESRMRKLEGRLRDGMTKRGITGEAADNIIRSITSFALYGFPESHAASFALLAYASAYLKTHYPAAFYTALLNNQPMGFYHPATLVKDAQRHRQRIKPIDISQSDWLCTIEKEGSIRLGLVYVNGLREVVGKTVATERLRRPFASITDLQRRTGLKRVEMASLASIGALNCFGLKRRDALWQIEKACRPAGPLLDDYSDSDSDVSPLRDMNPEERLIADFYGTGLTVGPHPMAFFRSQLGSKGIVPAAELAHLEDGRRVRVAGGVIVRQKPGTARGFFFITLEDETGIANVIVHPRLFEKERTTLVDQAFLLIEGIVQNQERVTSVKANRVWPLKGLQIRHRAHNFH
jgi:error-prone DNA polymerase